MMKKLMLVAAAAALLALAPLSPASASGCPPPEEGQPCDIQPWDPPVIPIYCKIKGNC